MDSSPGKVHWSIPVGKYISSLLVNPVLKHLWNMHSKKLFLTFIIKSGMSSSFRFVVVWTVLFLNLLNKRLRVLCRASFWNQKLDEKVVHVLILKDLRLFIIILIFPIILRLWADHLLYPLHEAVCCFDHQSVFCT